ncbi:MAG: FAD-dependent oxidoreductase [Thaumarchaeota archaeon]|nr:FAD-dependent oxidoreductase [Nitrososphaerota archaeon]
MLEGKHDHSTGRGEYDVIVVGAGPGGSATALTLARKGVKVLLVEKSKSPGASNVSGGVLYGDFTKGYGLVDLVPGFESEAPLERKVMSHEVNILSEPDSRRGSYHKYRLHGNSILARLGLFTVEIQTGHDYTIIRSDFDQWLAQKAVEAGAVLSTQTTVRELLLEDEKEAQDDDSEPVVVGVRTSGESIRARLVVDCAGVTSNLVEMAGLRGTLGPRQLYHAMKHVYRLPSEAIDRRFELREGEGRAINCFGDFMRGVSGSSFIFTNRDTVSVGVVAALDSMVRVFTERFDTVGKLVEVLDAFEAHPFTADLLDGGELLEFSAHNIPRGNVAMLKKPYASGYLVTGDALGAFIKIGPLFDGLRRAIATGIMAAETYLLASESGSFRGSNLSRYKDMLSPIYEDVNRYGRESFFGESGFAYSFIPRILFSSSAFSKQVKFDPAEARKKKSNGGALESSRGEEPAQITVNIEAASKSSSKPWVPSCPKDCFTLVTPKGKFASYKDLYDANLRALSSSAEDRGGLGVRAYKETTKDILEGKVGFELATCIGCGTCGEIGPREMVTFRVEEGGRGVRYRYG